MKHLSKSTFLLLVILLSVLSTKSQVNDANTGTKPFNLVVFPDTQIYSKDRPDWRNSSRQEVFMAMTKWVANHAAKDNIRFVLHMGDIVNEDEEPYEWRNADEAMSVLDGVVPYVFAIGNHDMLPGKDPVWIPDSTRNTTNFNQTFPYTRYQNEKWYGGRMLDDPFVPGNTYDNSYHFFSEGKLEFMILSLEVGPTDKMLLWADSLITLYPAKRVIIMTHSYMLAEDKRDYPGGFGYLPAGSNTGEEIWQKLVKKHANIFLVLCGHVTNTDTHRGLLISKGVNGNVVYQLLNGEGDDGWLRILRFAPRENKIYVSSFSPWKPANPDQQFKQYAFPLPGYDRDSIHQFALYYNMGR